MLVQLIRHATMVLEINDKRILIDPMLSPAGTMDPVADSPNERANPLVDLTIGIDELLMCDAVLLTHMHRDHFDAVAASIIPKDKPIYCQPEDKLRLIELGFTDVIAVEEETVCCDIVIQRTSGQHGQGELAEKMGPVSGYILTDNTGKNLYIAGDTVWCPEVRDSLIRYRPYVTVLYAGAARFNTGSPITMDNDDILNIVQTNPRMDVVIVHMEAFNHCLLTRSGLRRFFDVNAPAARLHIPDDGEKIIF